MKQWPRAKRRVKRDGDTAHNTLVLFNNVERFRFALRKARARVFQFKWRGTESARS